MRILQKNNWTKCKITRSGKKALKQYQIDEIEGKSTQYNSKDVLEMHIEAIAPFHVQLHGVGFQKEFVADKPKYTGDENSNANAVNKYHIQ